MEHFAGKYKLVKSENVAEYLMAIGVPEDRAKKGAASWPNADVTVNGKTMTLKTDQPANYSTTLVLGQEIDEKLSNGITVKTTTRLDGDKLIADSKGPYDYVGSKIYELSGDGLVVTLSSPKTSMTAKKFYKKL